MNGEDVLRGEDVKNGEDVSSGEDFWNGEDFLERRRCKCEDEKCQLKTN